MSLRATLNSLIVQASSRDLAEVAELLRSIDCAQDAEDRRSAHLQAPQLAGRRPGPKPAIRISGSSGTSTGGQNQNQNQGQNAPTPGGTSSSTPRAQASAPEIDGKTRRIIESGIRPACRLRPMSAPIR